DAAAKTWDATQETLQSVIARIHDGYPIDRMEQRADEYVNNIFERFHYIEIPQRPAILEIGSGVGFIMQGILRRIPDARITGLDIAKGMIAKAKERLRDHPDFKSGALAFREYNGERIPFNDDSFDLVYSVA